LRRQVRGVGADRIVETHLNPLSNSAKYRLRCCGLFAKLTRQRLKRGVFKSFVDLQPTRIITDTNNQPKRFVWTKQPDAILAALKRGRQTFESV